MAQTFEIMVENVSKFDRNQVRTLYSALTTDASAVGCDQNLRKKKVKWLEENHPWLVTGKKSKVRSVPMTPTPNKNPYEVQVASKYLQLFRSATKRGKDFDLSLKDVHYLLQAKTCYYTGEKFGTGDLKKTVDRVDNNKGYVKGNVVACTHLANKMKEQVFERPTQEWNKNIEFVAKFSQKILEHLEENNE